MQTSFSREYHSASFNVVVVEGSDIVCYVLEGKGIATTFEMVPGTHFSPAAPRLDRAMEVLLQQ